MTLILAMLSGILSDWQIPAAFVLLVVAVCWRARVARRQNVQLMIGCNLYVEMPQTSAGLVLLGVVVLSLLVVMFMIVPNGFLEHVLAILGKG